MTHLVDPTFLLRFLFSLGYFHNIFSPISDGALTLWSKITNPAGQSLKFT